MDIPNIMVEKSLVDKAVDKFQKLKVNLIKFEEELEDIHDHSKVQLLSNTIKFESFVNSYNNYLINDWVIRKKLSSIIGLIEALQDDILRLINTIDKKDQLNIKVIESLEQERLRLLEKELE